MKSIKGQTEVGYFRLIFHYFFARNKPLNIVLKNGVGVYIPLHQIISIVKLLENKWIILSVEENYLTMKGPHDEVITCRVDKGNDFGHLNEIYLDKVYGDNYANKNVIDVGMSNGDSSIYFAKEGSKRTVGIEPDKRSFNLAIKNIKASKVEDKVVALNKALNVTNENVKLIVYDKNPNANSVAKNNMVSLKDTKSEENVEAIRLKDVIDTFNEEQIDLLKLDCEGCEYAILRDLDKESFKKIRNLSMEFHNGLQDLQEILENNEFAVDIVRNSKSMGFLKAKRE